MFCAQSEVPERPDVSREVVGGAGFSKRNDGAAVRKRPYGRGPTETATDRIFASCGSNPLGPRKSPPASGRSWYRPSLVQEPPFGVVESQKRVPHHERSVPRWALHSKNQRGAEQIGVYPQPPASEVKVTE